MHVGKCDYSPAALPYFRGTQPDGASVISQPRWHCMCSPIISARAEHRGRQAVDRRDEGLRRPILSGLHDLDPLTMPVRATRLPQHQNPKNMLKTVARWSIRSTKGWPTPLQRVITQPRPTADRGWLYKIMARPSCVPVSILRVFPDIGAAPPRARTTHAEVSPKTGTPKATASRNRNCSAPQRGSDLA